ncbi:UPF0670 protein CG4666 [Papilio xuthus]|uniref:UPF0670 protein CG4666 n=1 Tax=Papilio xuthus TaxID=66420 RepID=A0A194PYM8_PAPXU|nr:UPF0670 protein CG4666 [Papilio xuthus]
MTMVAVYAQLISQPFSIKKFIYKALYQVALKRQQAAEDKIALHLASVDSGTALETLPPGRIYGMRVTGPCPSPGPEPDSVHEDQTPIHIDSETSDSLPDCASPDSAGSALTSRPRVQNEDTIENEGTVSTAGIEMLRKLFPGKKRSVLELVLRRCNHDLLRAVEHCNAIHGHQEKIASPSPGSSTSFETSVSSSEEVESRWSAFRPLVYWDDRSLFFEHEVVTIRDNEVRSLLVSRQFAIRKKDASTTKLLLKDLPGSHSKPTCPEYIKSWLNSMEINSAKLRNTI